MQRSLNINEEICKKIEQALCPLEEIVLKIATILFITPVFLLLKDNIEVNFNEKRL